MISGYRQRWSFMKILFILVIIALTGGAWYILYQKENKNKTEAQNNVADNELQNITVVDNLKMGVQSYDTMNPILTKNKEIINFDKLIFEPLFDIDDKYKIENSLAKSIKRIDELNYEVKVDTSIKWQDGTDISAKDVEFTCVELAKHPESTYYSNIKYVTGVTVVDNETIVFKLTKPINFFEYNLSFPILPQHYYVDEDFASSTKIPIGTGMYKIASINQENILLIRNDRWRKLKDSTPRSQSITIHKYDSVGEIFNAFKLGNIDAIHTNIRDYTQYVGTMGYNKKEYKGRDYDYVALNTQDNILKEAGVRKALALAIDKDHIVRSVYANTKYVSNSPLDYGSYLYDTKVFIPSNKEEAKKELKKAGWEYKDSSWFKDGKRLTLNLEVNENEARKAVAKDIKTQLGQIGVGINIINITNEKYGSNINNRNYQMMITGVTNSVNPDLTYFYGNGNLSKYTDKDIDAMLGDLSKYPDIERKELDIVSYIPLYRSKETILLNANVGGNFTPTPFNIYNNFHKWYRQQ